MRKIIVSTFISMDGVLQAPGGPQEDPSNNFKWGGWMFPYGDELTNEVLRESMSKPFDLLLGRRTYEIFAAHWPYQHNHPIAEKFNNVNKYVVATTPIDTSWQNTVLIKDDVVAALQNLKAQPGPDLLVNGSGNLIQTLLQHNLIDELRTWTFPVTIGIGKKLFAHGTQPAQWKVTDAKISPTGVIIANYVPNGDIRTGSFVPEEISELENLRRKKLMDESA